MSFSERERFFVPLRDIRYPLISPDDPSAITIELTDRDVVFRLEKERLAQPLLLRAGIIDLNKAFEQMPKDLISRCGRFPRINGAHFFPYFHDLREETYRILDENEYRAVGYNHKHFLYPVMQGGFIAQIAETKLFRRIFGVHQLGPNRHYPLANDHNRGEHSIYLTVNLVRSLQALDEKNHHNLVSKLRLDFGNNGLIAEAVTDEHIVDLACDLLVVCGMLHDLMTPSGGDTFKYLLKMKEEDDLHRLFSEGIPSLDEEKNELMTILSARGLNDRQLSYAVDCVRGQSGSLLGEMIHPEGKDQLDWDRIAYTLLDGQTAGFLYQEIPNSLLPKKITHQSEQLVVDWLDSVLDTLGRSEISACLGIPLLCASRSTNYPVVPTNFIDPSDNWILDNQGHLICTEPRRLLMVAAIRVWMVGLHYAGFKMLGIESEIQTRLEQLMDRPDVKSILSNENVLSWDDQTLWSELGRINDEKLQAILARRESVAATTLFTGGLVDQSLPIDPKAFKSFPLIIKPGFESLIQYRERVITLESFMNRFPHSSISKKLLEAFNLLSNKNVVIYLR